MIVLRRLLASALVVAVLSSAAPAAADSCLPAAGRVGRTSIRGVRLGATARLGDPRAVAASYCVDHGGELSFAVDESSSVLLVVSTAAGDAVRGVGPGDPVSSLGAMKPLGRSASADVYLLGGENQIVIATARGRVAFVAAADRLLLASRGKLSYWLRRLGY